MFVLKKGKSKFIYLPVTPSTAITAGTVVTYSAGLLVAATSATNAVDLLGVLKHNISITDVDYATSRNVEVEVPLEKNVEYDVDVTSGLVASDIMKEVDLTDGNNINRAASAVKVARCTAVYSTVKGRFLVKFQGAY